MYIRLVNLPKKQSFFLFGPRGVGKSTLVEHEFSPLSTYFISLLSVKVETQLAKDPDALIAIVEALPKTIKTVVIDEVQKLPRLLDVIHHLIEKTSLQFVLTGSSARKLKHGGANLLAGRAFERTLWPLTHRELGNDFRLHEALKFGTLPKIFHLETDADKNDFLQAYAHTYLKEEVWAEHLVKSLDPFRLFLEIAGQCDGKIVNYSKIAKQVRVDYKTVQSYFDILCDTWIGFYLNSFSHKVRERAVKSPKFYFFDVGVGRALADWLQVVPVPSTSYFGEVFESWFIAESFRLESYMKRGYRFSFFQEGNQEIDLIVSRPKGKNLFIEIKSSDRASEDDAKRLYAIAEKISSKPECWVVSRDETTKKYGQVRCLFWKQALDELFPFAEAKV